MLSIPIIFVFGSQTLAISTFEHRHANNMAYGLFDTRPDPCCHVCVCVSLLKRVSLECCRIETVAWAWQVCASFSCEGGVWWQTNGFEAQRVNVQFFVTFARVQNHMIKRHIRLWPGVEYGNGNRWNQLEAKSTHISRNDSNDRFLWDISRELFHFTWVSQPWDIRKEPLPSQGGKLQMKRLCNLGGLVEPIPVLVELLSLLQPEFRWKPIFSGWHPWRSWLCAHQAGCSASKGSIGRSFWGSTFGFCMP